MWLITLLLAEIPICLRMQSRWQKPLSGAIAVSRHDDDLSLTPGQPVTSSAGAAITSGQKRRIDTMQEHPLQSGSLIQPGNFLSQSGSVIFIDSRQAAFRDSDPPLIMASVLSTATDFEVGWISIWPCQDARSNNYPEVDNNVCMRTCGEKNETGEALFEDSFFSENCVFDSYVMTAEGHATSVQGNCYGNWIFGYAEPAENASYNRTAFKTETPALCQAACQMDSENCEAWIWASELAGNDGQKTCMLKNTIQIEEAMKQATYTNSKIDPQYCQVGMGVLCMRQSYDCQPCQDFIPRCVWKSANYLSGYRGCGLDPNGQPHDYCEIYANSEQFPGGPTNPSGILESSQTDPSTTEAHEAPHSSGIAPASESVTGVVNVTTQADYYLGANDAEIPRSQTSITKVIIPVAAVTATGVVVFGLGFKICSARAAAAKRSLDTGHIELQYEDLRAAGLEQDVVSPGERRCSDITGSRQISTITGSRTFLGGAYFTTHLR